MDRDGGEKASEARSLFIQQSRRRRRGGNGCSFGGRLNTHRHSVNAPTPNTNRRGLPMSLGLGETRTVRWTQGEFHGAQRTFRRPCRRRSLIRWQAPKAAFCSRGSKILRERELCRRSANFFFFPSTQPASPVPNFSAASGDIEQLFPRQRPESIPARPGNREDSQRKSSTRGRSPSERFAEFTKTPIKRVHYRRSLARSVNRQNFSNSSVRHHFVVPRGDRARWKGGIPRRAGAAAAEPSAVRVTQPCESFVAAGRGGEDKQES